MAGAFQSSAFQNSAFQTGGVVPPTPTPSTGGGGGSLKQLRREHERRRKVERALDRAIAEALNPTPVAEFTDPKLSEKVGKVWTAPQRQTVFPDVWRELQLVALLGAAVEDVQARVRALVSQQLAQHRAQMMVLAQDEEAASALLALMVRDLI